MSDEVKFRWLVKVAKMVGEEFYLGRAEYTTRTETIANDGKEFRRDVHEQVPMAVRVKVKSVTLANYGSFSAMVNCDRVDDEHGLHSYQVGWEKLRNDEESAVRDAEHEIAEFASRLRPKDAAE